MIDKNPPARLGAQKAAGFRKLHDRGKAIAFPTNHPVMGDENDPRAVQKDLPNPADQTGARRKAIGQIMKDKLAGSAPGKKP